MKKEIEELRKSMAAEGIDLYYATESDPHGSEYVNEHYKACEFLSGLLSECQELVVTADEARVWTDTRFFLQAERDLAGSGIELMKMGEDGVPTVIEYIKGYIAGCAKSRPGAGFVIGFDGSTVPASKGRKFEEELVKASDKVELKTDRDLAGELWKDRPEIEASEIWELPIEYAGKSAGEKIADVRAAMKEKGADYLLLSDLTETAWLFNLRGSDVECTPVFYSYTLIEPDAVRLYTDHKTAPAMTYPCTENRPLCCIFDDIAELDDSKTVWLDSGSCNYELVRRLPRGIKLIDEATPASMMKSVKNSTETECAKRAHIKDGAAVTEFIKWIKDIAAESAGNGFLTDPAAGKPLTETGAADHLEVRRRAHGCFDLSFPTISAYGPNAAIPHYTPERETALTVRPEGFLLVDSGGQYYEGTTDITRTIAVGPLTQEMIDNYTYVLKGHIALSRFVIKPGTVNNELDKASRAPLQAAGIDFGHGVSHGVGQVLAVHEDPAGVKRNDDPCIMVPGMIISNEPGYYKAGEYGIRIENLILLTEGHEEGTTESVPLTCVPYERDAINAELLTDEEKAWINSYHEWVRETLAPVIDEEAAAFLLKATSPL